MTGDDRARFARDEDGASLIIAMVVMMLLTTLSMALLGRTLAVMTSVRHGQDYDAALAVADAGLSDALFKIDQSAPPNWSSTAPSGNGSFTYWAQKRDPSTYVVSVKGTVGASSHGIQALVKRSAQFPYALFSDQQLNFNGTTIAGVGMNFYSYNTLVGHDEVRVGSNDTVNCAGTPDPNVYIDWGESMSDCQSTKVNKLSKKVEMRVDPPTGSTLPCPTGGLFGLSNSINLNLSVSLDLANPVTLAGLPTAYIPAGTYVCTQDVVLRGLLIPQGGPVKIYILPSTSGGTSVDHGLDMSNALINPLSAASNFQIFKAGGVPIVSNATTVSNLTCRCVIYAPETTMRINGGLWWAGSFNFAQLDVNGGPNIKIGYDQDLATYLGPDWRVSRYREIPSAEADPTVTTTTSTTTTSTTQPPTTSTTSTTAPPATTTSTSTTQPPTTTTSTTQPPTTTSTSTTLIPCIPLPLHPCP